jgi:hypothetical protein
MKEWEEYQSILREIQSEGSYQSYATKQNTKFKEWLGTGPKRYTSPYTSSAPTTSRTGLGPLAESEDIIPEIKDDLNREIWDDNNKLYPEISEKLLRIARDFYEKLELPAEILDITFTGSMANYNWTNKSDIDLHIIIDYAAVDENIELVRNYLMEAKSNWNRNHEIMIKDHEVEIYVQNANEPHHSTAVYSILKNEWEIEAEKQNFEVSESAVRQKAEAIETNIKLIEDIYENGRYEESYGDSDRLRAKLSKYRQCGLEHGGEYSVENLVFKYLRNSGLLEVLADIKKNSYDGMMSLGEVKR